MVELWKNMRSWGLWVGFRSGIFGDGRKMCDRTFYKKPQKSHKGRYRQNGNARPNPIVQNDRMQKQNDKMTVINPGKPQ